MITNRIAYWRSTMDGGRGITKAHLARRLAVSRSFITKLEKGSARPGAELMLRMAAYFKQPVELIFQQEGNDTFKSFLEVAAVPVKPLCNPMTVPPTCPVGMDAFTDKSLLAATAKEVASPVAQ